MKLEIDNYRISRLDDLNIVLEKYTKLNPRNPYGRNGSKGQEKKVTEEKYKYIRIGYYGTVQQALQKLIDHNLLQGDGEITAQEIISHIHELKDSIAQKI